MSAALPEVPPVLRCSGSTDPSPDGDSVGLEPSGIAGVPVGPLEVAGSREGAGAPGIQSRG